MEEGGHGLGDLLVVTSVVLLRNVCNVVDCGRLESGECLHGKGRILFSERDKHRNGSYLHCFLVGGHSTPLAALQEHFNVRRLFAVVTQVVPQMGSHRLSHLFKLKHFLHCRLFHQLVEQVHCLENVAEVGRTLHLKLKHKVRQDNALRNYLLNLVNDLVRLLLNLRLLVHAALN